MRNFSIYPTILKNPGHELDSYAAKFSDDARYYLTGAPLSAKAFYDKFQDSLGLVHYIRNQKIDISYDVNQMESFTCVFSDDSRLQKDIAEGRARIICFEKDRARFDKNVLFWKNQGALINEQFFQGEVFEAVYNVYKLNRTVIDRIEIFLTSRCTLNCEKCIAYIPYFKERINTDIDTLKKDADILFRHVDFVRKLKLLGGEGFLYPYLGEYLKYIDKHYSSKIGSIRIGTNGTIFPDVELLNICKECKVIADISDYRDAVPGICKLDEVRDYLEQHGIQTDIKRTGEQWLDMGFPNNIPPY